VKFIIADLRFSFGNEEEEFWLPPIFRLMIVTIMKGGQKKGTPKSSFY
jgi:hypothetical protein